MKAIVIDKFVESYDELRTTTIPDPEPSSDTIIVNITHAGLNYVDLLYARGKHQNNRTFVRPPFTLGLEYAGVVASAPESSKLKPGDRVFGGGIGGFSEKIAVAESQVQKLPDGWSARDAAGMAATAPVSYGALVRIAKVQPGEKVLVHAAAGGLGVMAVQIAKALGAEVIATVGSLEKGKILGSLGASHVIDYSKEGWEGEVLKATGDTGVDVVYDSVGLVEKSIRCCKYAGRILIVGFAGREGNLEKIAANRVLLKSITLHGYRFGEHGRQFPGETAAVWAGLNQMLIKGQVRPVVYDEPFNSLDSVPRAMKAMADRKVWGKAIINIASESSASKL